MPNVVRNKLNQTLEVTILDESGSPTALRIPAHETSDPLPIERVPSHTHQLAANGHLKIRTVA